MGAASHYPVLAAALARTTGPVLEMGMGDYSTPMLHMLCKDRLLVSVENDPVWAAEFEEYRSPNHQIHMVKGAPARKAWEACDIIEQHQWSVALIDHWSDYRYDIALRLKGRCKFIVCHDVEEMWAPPGYAAGYHWSEMMGKFKYETIWRRYVPYTAIFSDDEEFSL